MAWTSEPLAGVINGVNRDFNLSFVPVPESLKIFFTGIHMELVGSQPGQMQYAYTINGTAVTLGLAPTTGQVPWAEYWH